MTTLADRAYALAPKPIARPAPPLLASRAFGAGAEGSSLAERPAFSFGKLPLQATPGQAVMRASGEDPQGGLRSPRFAGVPVLEACAADQARLAEGAEGDAVERVQQALADLGYDLGGSGAGGFGVDGQYGPRTAAAVRAFKADHDLGSTQFGDVGPRTIQTLDALFPADTGPAVPTALKDDAGSASSCPVVDDDAPDPVSADGQNAESLASPQPAHLLLNAALPANQAPAAPVGHLHIDETVRRFKQAVNADVSGGHAGDNLTQSGQFIWTNRIKDTIDDQLAPLSAGDPDARRFAARARETIVALLDRDDGAQGMLGDLARMATASRSPQKAMILSLVKRPPRSGAEIDTLLWGRLNADPANQMPDVTEFASMRILDVVYRAESILCGTQAARVVARLRRRGPLKPAAPKGPVIFADLSGPAVRDRRPGPRPDTVLGDTFRQPNVAGTVARLKLVLDGGRQVHARVLSGVGYGSADVSPDASARPAPLGPPPEEHSLVILGYDGDTFVFNDPDAGVSHSPETGFGELFFSGGRLTTAKNDADLFVDSDGDHERGDHRYQVIRLATF